MLPGRKDLRAAGRLLAQDLSTASIQSAAEHVWQAMFHVDEWPEHLQHQADEVNRQMLRHGPIHVTVRQMDTRELNALRHEILTLIAAAERLD